mgnify:CR=1 FL=1
MSAKAPLPEVFPSENIVYCAAGGGADGPAGRRGDAVLQNIFQLVDMRSFSSLWYWIALAVTWSTTSHWVLGVPFDMVSRARRHAGPAGDDLVTLTRINVARLLLIGREAGLALSLVVSCLLSLLVVLGFVYHVEFAQAAALILVPLSLVGLLSLRAAERLEPGLQPGGLDAEAVAQALTRHRFRVQLVGLTAISVTALWGMFQNLSHYYVG